jgi:uncharacterized repeat protein (TIGR01451 family)
MIRGLRFLLVVTVVALASGTGSILAATRTWTGAGGDGNWSTAANWGGTAPLAGDDLLFPDGAARMTTNSNDLSWWTSFNSISFTGPAGGYNLAGNGISLAAGITAANGATNTISLDVRIAPSQTFNVSGAGAGTLNFAGTIWLDHSTLTLAGPNGMVSLGVIAQSGSGGVSSSVGYAYLTANSTYTGPTTITGGNFLIANSHSLSPSSAVTVSGGTLQFANSGSAGPVTVNPAATLYCGGGNLDQIGNVTDLSLQSGSTLHMDMNTVLNHGKLNASGNVSLGGATLSVAWSFISITGDAFTLINKTSSGAVTGTFNGLAEGATFVVQGRNYQITYTGGDGNDVVITDIGLPPPDLTISKKHAGNFTQGQTGAQYTIGVHNNGFGSTDGTTVFVTDTLPSSLTATALAGPGWNCVLGTLTCTRADVLAPGNYPVITLTVNVAANAPASITNVAAVSGGGDASPSKTGASDPTTVTTTPTPGPNIPTTGGGGAIAFIVLLAAAGVLLVRRYAS